MVKGSDAMTTFSARKRPVEIISAREYIKRRKNDPKSVEGARPVTPRLGSRKFAMFAIKRDVPVYEVFPGRKG
jgi:hypothetical protein